MELKDQAPAPTLARRLGEPAHVSGLAFRLARVTGAGQRLAEWLLKVAVERGAAHYQRSFDPTLPRDNPAISDEEIGIALCLGQHLSPRPVPRTDALPHWTRLVSHTGVSARGGPPKTDWLCRRE